MSKKAPLPCSGESESLTIQDQRLQEQKIEMKKEMESHNNQEQASRSHSYFTSVTFDPVSFYSDSRTQDGQAKPYSTTPYGDLPPAAELPVYNEAKYFPYHNMPLKELGFETRKQLGLRLDPEYPTVSNWKTLADELGFSNLAIKNIESQRNKTQEMLDVYTAEQPNATVGVICEIIDSKMRRTDVISDMSPFFERDYERLRRQPRISGASVAGPSHVMTSSMMTSSTTNRPPPSFFTHLTTCRDEIQDSEVTSSPAAPRLSINQKYDGFVMYNRSDKTFIIDEFLPRLEKKEKMKLFIPERDLEGGMQAFDTRLSLMIQNCHKLVVILSDEFLRDGQSQWELNLAISIDPTARRQKIIPVIYKAISETNVLSGINACDRTRVLDDEWFWNNLVRSLGGSKNKST